MVSGANACRFRERPGIFSRQATQFVMTSPVTPKGACWCALQQDAKETVTETGIRSNTKPTALMRFLPFAFCLSRCSLVPCALSSQSELVRKVTVVVVGQLRAGVNSSGGSGRLLGRAWRSRATALEAGRPRCRVSTAVAAEIKDTAGASMPSWCTHYKKPRRDRLLASVMQDSWRSPERRPPAPLGGGTKSLHLAAL